MGGGPSLPLLNLGQIMRDQVLHKWLSLIGLLVQLLGILLLLLDLSQLSLLSLLSLLELGLSELPDPV